MKQQVSTPNVPPGQPMPENLTAKRKYAAPTIQLHPVDKLILGAGMSGPDEGSPFPRA
jgi:hypothetical protein